jgi:uncharacterized membrane protein YphA (DoxX/SURF4 family)
MNPSSAVDFRSHSFEMPAWKSVVSHVGAFLVALLFLSAGIWKMTDPFRWMSMVEQLLVPYPLSLMATLALGVSETLAGVLILIPKYRRWGALLASGLLVVFMLYIGINYSRLIGKDCSCFPWVKRTIGPAFFEGDALMLVAAVIAGWWARPARGLRTALAVLAGIAVLSGASYGYNLISQTGAKAPDSITVDGKPYSLAHGRVFLFFYDPTCSHCDEAARHMSTYHWMDDVTVIAVPTTLPRFAASFIHDTKLKATTSFDLDPLKKIFTFGDPPYGVALENGREKAPVPHFDDPEPGTTLKKLGYIE